MPAPPDLTIQRYDAVGARKICATVALIHREAYARRIESGDPFSADEAFMGRFDSYTAVEGFDMILACVDGQPVGQAWGWPLASDTQWWDGLTAEPEPGFTGEDGTRTFALSELMVRQAYTGRHLGRALHDVLLSSRNEDRATLIVNPVNETAYEMYRRWGWRKAPDSGQPGRTRPLFDVLILPLPLPA